MRVTLPWESVTAAAAVARCWVGRKICANGPEDGDELNEGGLRGLRDLVVPGDRGLQGGQLFVGLSRERGLLGDLILHPVQFGLRRLLGELGFL